MHECDWMVTYHSKWTLKIEFSTLIDCTYENFSFNCLEVSALLEFNRIRCNEILSNLSPLILYAQQKIGRHQDPDIDKKPKAEANADQIKTFCLQCEIASATILMFLSGFWKYKLYLNANLFVGINCLVAVINGVYMCSLHNRTYTDTPAYTKNVFKTHLF